MKIGKFEFQLPKFGSFRKRVAFPKIPASAMGKKKFAVNAEAILRSPILYNTLAILTCSYFVASFFAKALLPFLPDTHTAKPRAVIKTVDMNQYDSIYTRNLFNEKGLIPDLDASKFGDGTPVKTSLPLNLMGVIVVEDSLKSVASVEDRGSNQVIAVRVNDAIVPNTVVQKIEENKLIFLNKSTGRREFIDLPVDGPMPSIRLVKDSGGGGIKETSPGRFQIDRKLVDKTLSNLGVALTQARCVPNFEGGKPAGYRCGEIVPGSIYDQLGMKNDDVICGINGQSINDPGKAFEIFGQLKSMNNVEICINRHGAISNMNYDIN